VNLLSFKPSVDFSCAETPFLLLYPSQEATFVTYFLTLQKQLLKRKENRSSVILENIRLDHPIPPVAEDNSTQKTYQISFEIAPTLA